VWTDRRAASVSSVTSGDGDAGREPVAMAASVP